MSNNLNQGASIEAERAYKSWQNEQPNRCWVAPWHMLTDTQRAEWVAEIEAARRTPADAVGAVNVKTWQERMNAEGLYAEGERLYGGWTAVTMARDAEIADLRAQLAPKGQGNAKFDLTDYSHAVNYSNGTSTVVIAPASAQSADPAAKTNSSSNSSNTSISAQPDQRESAAVPHGAMEVGSRMAAWLYGLSKSSLPFQSWADKCKRLSDEWDRIAAAPSPAAQPVAKEEQVCDSNHAEIGFPCCYTQGKDSANNGAEGEKNGEG
jgi:hypothetical protein